jgi:hypothetical protein
MGHPLVPGLNEVKSLREIGSFFASLLQINIASHFALGLCFIPAYSYRRPNRKGLSSRGVAFQTTSERASKAKDPTSLDDVHKGVSVCLRSPAERTKGR